MAQHPRYAIMPPRLFGSVAYYMVLRRYDAVVIDTALRYDKSRKEIHRFDIADTRGPLRLTVPVSRPTGTTLWQQVLVSAHGRWYETLPVALESAYGRTPFFEFYIDRLRPLFDTTGSSIIDMCSAANAAMLKILGADTKIIPEIPLGEAYDDLRDADIDAMADTSAPYWQVRHTKLGFIPNLSILDLVFNLGPEADLYLKP